MSRLVVASTILATIAMLSVFAVAGYAQLQWSRSTNDNCRAIHRIVNAGERILDPEAQLRFALEEGLVTRREYREQLARARKLRPLTERQLGLWRTADCKPK